MELSNDQFDNTIASHDVVIVDFAADWCSPCRALAPTLAALEEENEGKIKVFSVNIDSEHDLAVRYDITSVPTILFFKKGEQVRRIVGLKSKMDLQEEIDGLLEGEKHE